MYRYKTLVRPHQHNQLCDLFLPCSCQAIWNSQTIIVFIRKISLYSHLRFKLYFCWGFFSILVLIVKQMPLFQFEDKCGMVLLQDNFVWLRDLFLISYIKHKNRTTRNSYCFYCFELFLNGLLYYFLFVAKERVYLVVQTLKLCSTIINSGWDEVAPLMQCKFCCATFNIRL